MNINKVFIQPLEDLPIQSVTDLTGNTFFKIVPANEFYAECQNPFVDNICCVGIDNLVFYSKTFKKACINYEIIK